LSWDQFFSDPVPTPGGMDLKTLRDAGAYISKLRKSEHESEEWQTAMHCLIQAADHGGPVEFARMGMMQALGRHRERPRNPLRKPTHWAKRKLKREQ
jgi:dihydrodipicolinate synthase/N-acetylneuraminate lyase